MIGRLLIWTGVLKPLQPSPSSRAGVHDCPGEVMGLSEPRLIGPVIVEAVKLVGRREARPWRGAPIRSHVPQHGHRGRILLGSAPHSATRNSYGTAGPHAVAPETGRRSWSSLF